MLKQLIESKKIGGATRIIWKEGKIIYQQTEGYRNMETKESLTMDTIFRIASMTKTITSVLAMMLYEEGKLHLGDFQPDGMSLSPTFFSLRGDLPTFLDTY